MSVNPTLYNWKKEDLYYGKNKTGYSLFCNREIAETKFYQVRWPDGVLSEDFYNRIRAKEHAVVSAAKDRRNIVYLSPAEAHG